jgi:aspartate/methionine/tyrosine aminotransferase
LFPKNNNKGMIELPPPRKLREIAARMLLFEDDFEAANPVGKTPHADVHQYRARFGEKSFREAIAGLMQGEYGCPAVQPENILATSGVSGAVVSVLRSLQMAKEEGDLRVALLEPFYTYHNVQARTAVGSSPSVVKCAPDLGPDFEQISAALEEGVDVLIFCNPGNPQGNVWTREQVRELVDLAKRHGTVLLVDEIYADFVHDPYRTPFYTPVSEAELPDHVLVCRGFSKCLGAQSWRTGFLVAARSRIEQVMRVHDPLYISVTWQQHAIAEYIATFPEDYDAHVRSVCDQCAKNWRALAPLLEAEFGWKAIEPKGSMYALFDYGDTAKTDMEAVVVALKRGIGVAPGNIFFSGVPERTGLIRIHVGFSTEKLLKLVAMFGGEEKMMFGETALDSVTYGKWNVRIQPQETFELAGTQQKVTIDQNDKGFGELGSRVWDGSAVLAQYFDQCAAEEKSTTEASSLGFAVQIRGAHALELGSGTGLAGVALAKVGAKEVILTDKQALVPLLQHNASINGVGECVQSCELFWGEDLSADTFPGPLAEAVARGPGGLDFIFGADLTYDFDDLPVLVSTIVSVLRPFPNAVCLIAYGLERAATPEFLRQAAERFDVQVLDAANIRQLEDSRRTHVIGIAVLHQKKKK